MQATDQMKRFLVSYKLVIFYGVIFSLNALAASIMASFLNVEWGDLTVTSKFLVIVAIFQNWTGTLLAFMNKSASNVQSGKPVFENLSMPPQPTTNQGKP